MHSWKLPVLGGNSQHFSLKIFSHIHIKGRRAQAWKTFKASSSNIERFGSSSEESHLFKTTFTLRCLLHPKLTALGRGRTLNNKLKEGEDLRKQQRRDVELKNVKRDTGSNLVNGRVLKSHLSLDLDKQRFLVVTPPSSYLPCR
ncbi:hypothetical protein CDAR_277561 [Caerostris darwini]|uniref:Uncharacterized protein n=1 Tax=Caerostris darwini TaxID=1538125 RepID=A0AAV4VUC7_9ARAC|nr:hypothetical protein CDAR_277561 [Caerostris darwini]